MVVMLAQQVAVSSSSMPRLVMLHSVVSFFFNVSIIAITVNVVAGVLLPDLSYEH